MIRREQVHPNEAGIVTLDMLIEAAIRGCTTLDFAGGCLSIVVDRSPTGLPGEMVTTGAIMEWRHDARVQPRPEQFEQPTARWTQPPIIGRASGESVIGREPSPRPRRRWTARTRSHDGLRRPAGIGTRTLRTRMASTTPGWMRRTSRSRWPRHERPRRRRVEPTEPEGGATVPEPGDYGRSGSSGHRPSSADHRSKDGGNVRRRRFARTATIWSLHA
jgi:hypothetical protein